MKKCLITIALLTIIGGFCLAQEPVGVATVIYDQAQPTVTTTSSLLLNNLSFEAIKIHLSLAGLTGNINPEGESLDILKNTEDLVKTDIIQALSLSSNKQQTLQAYLTQCEEYLEKGSSLIAFMEQELALLKLDINSCTMDKTLTDKLYFDSVNNYDQATSEQALQESIQNDACISQENVEYNAKSYILNGLTFYEGLLQEKYNLISAKQDMLINHFDVISDNVLTELQTINDTLKKYQF
jgi:hypothetical protein